MLQTSLPPTQFLPQRLSQVDNITLSHTKAATPRALAYPTTPHTSSTRRVIARHNVCRRVIRSKPQRTRRTAGVVTTCHLRLRRSLIRFAMTFVLDLALRCVCHLGKTQNCDETDVHNRWFCGCKILLSLSDWFRYCCECRCGVVGLTELINYNAFLYDFRQAVCCHRRR